MERERPPVGQEVESASLHGRSDEAHADGVESGGHGRASEPDSDATVRTAARGDRPPAQNSHDRDAGHDMGARQAQSGAQPAHGHAEGGSGHEHGVDHSGHEALFRRRFWVCLVLSLPVLVYSETLQGWFGFTPPWSSAGVWVTPIFAGLVFIYGGVPFLTMAWPELRDRQPGMMTLISLAIAVAAIYSYATLFMSSAEGFFWELVTLIDIMLLGHWIEMRSVRLASGALEALAKLVPDTAERLDESGAPHEVPVGELRQADLVLVRPGQNVPVDGVVVDGASAVNESMLTGESVPVDKGAGDQVIAGSINGDGSLRVRVEATGEATALAGIMRLVDEAQRSRSRTQVLADRAAAWLFYLALGTALVTAAVWTIVIGPSQEVVSRVATVLVIACPHALGLAIPLVVALVTSRGAAQGILVRDREALEEARRLDTVVFDKTGTLTTGEFRVAEMEAAEGQSREAALAMAAALEADSQHPLAAGIRRSAEEHDVQPVRVRDFESLSGRGVRARHDGSEQYIGGPRLLEMLGIGEPVENSGDGLKRIASLTARAHEKGRTLIYLVSDNRIVAAFALADTVRPESRQAVRDLQAMGIEVAMLTGDAEPVAREVAGQLGIDQYFAEVLPEHKDGSVAEIQRRGRRVAMVGDGVNDAPALARADVGIAIGSGTDVAMRSAGIVLVSSDPRGVPTAIRLSRAGYRKMVQNLAWATGYNIFALPVAAGVLAPFGILLSPAIGAILMSASTVVVALNAQLLRRQRV